MSTSPTGRRASGLLRLLLVAVAMSAVASTTSGAAVMPPPSLPPVVEPPLVPLEGSAPVVAAARDTAAESPESDATDCSDPATQCDLGTPEPALVETVPDPSCRSDGQHAPEGTTRVAPAPGTGGSQGRVLRYQVEVEDGLAIDESCFASLINAILNDPRGWGADGSISFRQVAEDPDFRLILASPEMTDRLCYPLNTGGKYSCRSQNGVILNLNRWENGTDEYTDDLETYREYLVNHEVGHVLGHGHVECPGPGEPAPVMMQQTKGLDECLLNGWPTSDER